jgi:hypothetical protein
MRYPGGNFYSGNRPARLAGKNIPYWRIQMGGST